MCPADESPVTSNVYPGRVPAHPSHSDPDPLGGRPQVERIDLGHTTYVVAKVPPLDVTGVRTVLVGSIIWLIGFIALLPFHATLVDHGRGWWLWTCLAGFGLGLLGLEYCRRRRHRLLQAEQDASVRDAE